MDFCPLLCDLGFETLEEVKSNNDDKLTIHNLTNGVMSEIYKCLNRQDIAGIIAKLLNVSDINC